MNNNIYIRRRKKIALPATMAGERLPLELVASGSEAKLYCNAMYVLFILYARARGRIVDSADVADTIFSVEHGTPYRLEEIASQHMG